MANSFDKRKFAALCMECRSVQIETARQECEDSKGLFKHVMYETTDMKDLADVPMDALLQLAECVPYYLGGESPWEARVREQVGCLRSTRAVKRKRVL